MPVNVVDLEQIVMKLPRKKGTEEGITSDIKRLLQVVKVKVEFTEIINDSLGDGIFPESWKTSSIIPIPKTIKAKKQVILDQLICCRFMKRY